MLSPPLDLDLARAAVALPGWRWVPGMLTLPREEEFRAGTTPMWESCRVLLVDEDGGVFVYPIGYPPWKGRECEMQRGALPDYRDPATAGCLLELLGPGWIAIFPDAPEFCIEYPNDATYYGSTLAETCIRAAIARGGWRDPNFNDTDRSTT